MQDTAALALAAEGKVAENRQEAEEGGAILARAVEAMSRIEESSNQISRISEVMEDIAFQTNLLALNAGVEAARAGEAGKGFAVVATEVRALAQRATNSAKEIRTLVNTSRENVGEGADLVERTNRSLEALITRAADNAGTVADIAAAMKAQSSGLGELTGKLRQLERTAREGAATADMSSSMSAALRGDAQAMLTSAEAFRDPQGWAGIEAAPFAARADGADPDRPRAPVGGCWRRNSRRPGGQNPSGKGKGAARCGPVCLSDARVRPVRPCARPTSSGTPAAPGSATAIPSPPGIRPEAGVRLAVAGAFGQVDVGHREAPADQPGRRGKMGLHPRQRRRSFSAAMAMTPRPSGVSAVPLVMA